MEKTLTGGGRGGGGDKRTKLSSSISGASPAANDFIGK